jgi:glycosyltransferase involved in cell wall biosynthesis
VQNSESTPPVLVITWWPPGVVGFLHYRARIHAVLRCAPAVVVSNSEQAIEFLDVPTVPVRCIPQSRTGLSGVLQYFMECARIARQLQPGRVLLLHSQLAPLTLLLRGIPTYLFWNEHPTHFYSGRTGLAKAIKNTIMRHLTYLGARRATLAMPIGIHHAEDLLEHGCQSQRVQTIDMGVSDIFRNVSARTSPTAGTAISLIYIGSVQAERGRDVMIKAVGIANRNGPRATLTIVGADDAERQTCLRVAEQAGAGDAVKVFGRVAGSQIPTLLSNADVGLCFWEDRTYWKFNPPTKLFEYLVAGLPVVASDIRTHTAYIHDGLDGRICAYDARSLALVIVELAEDREQLARLRAGARQSGEQYLWSRIEPRFLEAIGLR